MVSKNYMFALLDDYDYKDNELDEAKKADEKEEYYWVTVSYNKRYIKKYKPSVAKIFSKRTGYDFQKIDR